MIAVRGELDLATAERLAEAADQAFGRGQFPMLIDLSETSFMDSAGVAVLVGLYRQLGQVKEALVVRGARPAVRRVLDLTGVSQLVTVEAETGNSDDSVGSPGPS